MTMQKITDGTYAIAERYDGDFEATVDDDRGAPIAAMRLPRALVMKLVRKLRKRTKSSKVREA